MTEHVTLTLRPPLAISPRLLPGVDIDGTWVQLDTQTWTIIIDHEGREYIEDDFRPGMLPADPSEAVRSAMGSVLSFLGAFAEACDPYYLSKYGPGENHDLFHADLAEWAYQNGDEIAMAGFDLEYGEEDR